MTDTNESLGKITAIDDFGSADVITIKNEKGELRFPHLEKVIKKIDLNKRQLIVIKEEFEKVVVSN